MDFLLETDYLTVHIIEVRDSRTGYVIPAHNGMGFGRMEKLSARCRRRRRRRHLEIQVDIQARKLYLEVFLWFWDPGERYLRMETGLLHRISMRIS